MALVRKINCLINKRILIALFLLALILVSSLPAFRSGVYFGHDIKFHLGRIQAIADGLQSGQFPVRYEASAWYGSGYVSGMFYGNIFLYIPALLYMVGMPVYRAYNIYVILVNALTVGVGYYSFKGLFDSKKWGLTAIIIYSLAGYRLTNVYMRASVGEYTAMAFVPLCIYGIYRIYKCKNMPIIRKVLPLVIGATGLIESHVLTTELMAIFIFIFAIINFKSTQQVIRELFAALGLIVGINLAFLVPFISAYTSMDLYINTTMLTTSIREDGLYLRQLFGILTEGSGSSAPWTWENEACYNTGFVMIACMVISVVCMLYFLISKKKTGEMQFKWTLQIFAFGILSAWMATIYFPWDLVAGDGLIDRLMSSVQYPWRYMMLVVICFTITAVYSIKHLCAGTTLDITKYRLITSSVILVIFIASVFAAGVFEYTLSCRNYTLYNVDADEDWADKLYLPVGTDSSVLEDAEVVVDGDTITLPVIGYNYLHVYAGDEELAWTVGENNYIQVDYSGDPSDLTVRFEEPISWRIAEILSVITVIYVFVLVHKSKKKM